MEKNAKIYVAGHRGMVGSAIVRELKRQGYENIITRTHAELDLCRQDDVEKFFAEEKPEYVFLAAAKVGGIVANEEALADFMYYNMTLEMNVIHSAWQNGCKKLEFLGSSCIYPRMAPQPMPESCLLTSELKTTKEPVFIPAPESFTDDPDLYPTGKQITKQLIDINVSVSVTDFITDEYRNRITGSRVHAPFPAGIVNDVNYGPSVKAFAFLLNNYYNVSINKTRQCISDITNGIVNISDGTIANLSEAFSAATEKDRAKIFSLLTHSNVLYSDATVSNINGKRKAVILCTDKKNVLYQHLEHKGHDGLTKTPVKDFDGILIHDHDKSYYSYGSKHQECLAHVLRYLVSAMENEPDLKWHKQMHSLLQKMIHMANKYKDGVPPEKVNSFTTEYKSILAVAADEYTLHPPAKEYMDGYNLHLKLSKYQKEHLLFLTHPEIDCTNNISERELRKFKRKQKQSVVLRSDSGGQRICNALTIIETARMQNQNIYDVVESAFKKGSSGVMVG